MVNRRCIENRIFDEISLGGEAGLSRTLTRRDIGLFFDEEFARNDMFHKIIAHDVWRASLISTAPRTELPGPGTIYAASLPVSGDRSVGAIRSPSAPRPKIAASDTPFLQCRKVADCVFIARTP